MEQDFDADDVRSLSERVLPLTSVSYTNNVSPRNSNRTRSIKPQKSISSDHQFFHDDDAVALPAVANPGDIRQLADGTRQKYNGSSWRRMCSKPNCSYYTQSGGLCKPHLAALKKRKTPTSRNPAPRDEDIVPVVQSASKSGEPKRGDIIVLSNGIRKKFDGRQYRRICANVHCAAVVHGSLEYQKGYVASSTTAYGCTLRFQPLSTTLSGISSQNTTECHLAIRNRVVATTNLLVHRSYSAGSPSFFRLVVAQTSTCSFSIIHAISFSSPAARDEVLRTAKVQCSSYHRHHSLDRRHAKSDER